MTATLFISTVVYNDTSMSTCYSTRWRSRCCCCCCTWATLFRVHKVFLALAFNTVSHSVPDAGSAVSVSVAFRCPGKPVCPLVRFEFDVRNFNRSGVAFRSVGGEKHIFHDEKTFEFSSSILLSSMFKVIDPLSLQMPLKFTIFSGRKCKLKGYSTVSHRKCRIIFHMNIQYIF